MHTEVIEVDDGPLSGRPVLARVARVIDYGFGLLYAALSLRLLLELVNARRSTGFFAFVHRITEPFFSPFEGIVPSDHIVGAHLVWSLVVAIVGYMILHAAVRGLLELVARR